MNKDILQGKWKQVKGKVKAQWGKLTDNDLDVMEGRTEELVGLLQERYGKKLAEAEKEVRDFCRSIEASAGT